MSTLKKRRRRFLSIVLMVVMITGFIPMEPLVAFADSIDKPFSITNTSLSDDGATLSWEYSYKEGSETSFELDTNLELEEESTGNLISEGKEIGTYTISKEGKLQIEINEEDVKNIIPTRKKASGHWPDAFLD